MDLRKHDLGITLGLLAIYFSLMTGLALTVDRGFFLNDAVALVVWLVIGLFFAASGARLWRQ